MACLVQGKHPGLAIIGVLIDILRVIVTEILRDNRSYNSNTLKTGGCKTAKAVREGCGSKEQGVCSFGLDTYP